MTYADYATFHPCFGEDICQVVKAKACADARESFGGASEKSVRENLESIIRRLEK
jgi:argininosuccinate lyase